MPPLPPSQHSSGGRLSVTCLTWGPNSTGDTADSRPSPCGLAVSLVRFQQKLSEWVTTTDSQPHTELEVFRYIALNTKRRHLFNVTRHRVVRLVGEMFQVKAEVDSIILQSFHNPSSVAARLSNASGALSTRHSGCSNRSCRGSVPSSPGTTPWCINTLFLVFRP